MTRSTRVAGRMAYAAVLGCLAVYSLHEINSYDAPWHLRTGQLILEGHSLPRKDPFSFSAPQDRTWVNHEWLSDVVFALLYKLGAERVLILTSAVVVLATALLASWPPTEIGAFLLLLGVEAAAPRIQVRPHLFTSLFAILFLRLGAKLLETGARRLLVAIIAIEVLWANLHGGFFLAPIILGIVLAGAGIDAARGFAVGRGTRELGTATLLSLVAPVLNPYGFGLLVQSYREVTSTFATSKIGEWAPAIRPGEPLEQPTIYLLALPLVGILAILGAGVTVSFAPKRFPLRSQDLLALVLFTALGLAARRNADLAAFGLVFVVGRLLTPLMERMGSVFRIALFVPTIVLAGAFSFDFVTNRYPTRNGYPGAFGLGLAKDIFPVHAADWILAHSPKGEMLNNYNVGGYLIYRLGPGRKVFMDGRNLVYGEDVLREYHEAAANGRLLMDLLDRRRIGYAIVDQSGSAIPFHAVLLAHPDFALADFDHAGAVYVRRSMNPTLVPADPLLTSAPLGELPPMPTAPKPQIPLVSRLGIWNRPLGRYGPHHGLGSFYSVARQPERARRELRLAAVETPYSPEVWFNLGAAELQSHALPEAEQALHVSLMLKPGDFDTRFALAETLSAKGSKADALAMIRTLSKEAPAREDVRVALVKILHESGNTTAAIQELRTLVNQNPARVDAATELASYLAEQGDREGAERELRAVVAKAPGFVPALGNLGSLLLAQNGFDEARRLAEAALHKSPGDPGAHKVVAYCDLHEGRLESCLGHFQVYLKQTPSDLNARNDLAVCLLQLGRRDEAKSILTAILQGRPDFKPAIENLQRMGEAPIP